jgi:hypothetical protein
MLFSECEKILIRSRQNQGTHHEEIRSDLSKDKWQERTKIIFRHAEVLVNGEHFVKSLRTAKALLLIRV